MNKLAWSMIVKGDDKEALMLDQCLSFLQGNVDGIFIAITNKENEPTNQKCIEVCNKYNAIWKPFTWVNDFSKARNFALSLIPAEYNYWGWCDADDGVRGAELMKPTIEANPDVDIFNINYLFHFDENKNTDVVHQKTMIAKNDGCVEWYRPLHEDFQPTRKITSKLVTGIERIHMADEQHFEDSKKRNVEIAKIAYENTPNDPGYMWNYGQSLFGVGEHDKAREIFEKFLSVSESEEEKYIVYITLGQMEGARNNTSKAIEWFRTAIGLRPLYPNAYHALGRLYYNIGQYTKAAEMITQGLTKKPPYHSIVVYNPRDYDYHPMLLLGKTFYALSRPDHALTCLEACEKMGIKNNETESIIKLLKHEKKFFDEILGIIERIERTAKKNPERLPKIFASLDGDQSAHPGICALRNKYIIKKESSGKDLVYYCGYTALPFSPNYAKRKGVGGSEEAVLNLVTEWKELGWNVTVYCNTGNLGEEHDGIKWLPYYMWNYRDKQDVTILWRQTQCLDIVDINSEKVFIDVHDVMAEGEFTPKRLEKITKVLVKTNFHRSLLPNVPDEKIEVIPNGMDFKLFNQKVKKNQKMIVNTSSPDRSLGAVIKIFKKVKERVPDAQMKWAYGFDLFKNVFATNEIRMKWVEDIEKGMADAGIENLGRLTQNQCAKLYLEGNVLLYPTEFAEIDCITVKKAQACECFPITTDFGAFPESVKTGTMIHSEKTKDTWAAPNSFHYEVTDEAMIDKFVDEVVFRLESDIGDRSEMKKLMDPFTWDKIALRWNELLTR